MTQNILEKIVELCKSGRTSEEKARESLRNIKEVASQNVNILTQILDDYIRQNQDDPVHRKNRLKGAKRMLNM